MMSEILRRIMWCPNGRSMPLIRLVILLLLTQPYFLTHNHAYGFYHSIASNTYLYRFIRFSKQQTAIPFDISNKFVGLAFQRSAMFQEFRSKISRNRALVSDSVLDQLSSDGEGDTVIGSDDGNQPNNSSQFDMKTATLLAGYAFDAYNEPVSCIRAAP